MTTRDEVERYPFLVQITNEDGGYCTISFPDLPSCFSECSNPAEILDYAMEAAVQWIDACKASGVAVPEPGTAVWVRNVACHD